MVVDNFRYNHLKMVLDDLGTLFSLKGFPVVIGISWESIRPNDL